jgi:AmiR/NasT family two-component response regulator
LNGLVVQPKRASACFAARRSDEHAVDKSGIDYDRLVVWAAGIVAAQARCNVDEAIALMQERGVRTRRTLRETAAAVIDRRIRFGRT